MFQPPQGSPPIVPGLTQGDGPAPGSLKPDEMLAMMMGNKPQMSGSPDKMAQVVQLLREIATGDPRMGSIAGEMLRVALEGPPRFAGAQGQPPMGGGGQSSSMPMLGPGGVS